MAVLFMGCEGGRPRQRNAVQCNKRTIVAFAQADTSTRRYGFSVCSAEFLISYPHQCRSLGAKATERMGTIAAYGLHRDGRHSVEYNFIFGHTSIWHSSGKDASTADQIISGSLQISAPSRPIRADHQTLIHILVAMILLGRTPWAAAPTVWMTLQTVHGSSHQWSLDGRKWRTSPRRTRDGRSDGG
jgi:hypothetical protein